MAVDVTMSHIEGLLISEDRGKRFKEKMKEVL